jgi:hypothetical protein
VLDPDTGLIERIPYERCVLVALCKAIRRREIWIEGGNLWRNPEDDLTPGLSGERGASQGDPRGPERGRELELGK